MLLLRGITLKGASNGLSYLLPNTKNLWSLNVNFSIKNIIEFIAKKNKINRKIKFLDVEIGCRTGILFVGY